MGEISIHPLSRQGHLKIRHNRFWLTTKADIYIVDLCVEPWRSCDVIIGHQRFLGNNFWMRQDTDYKTSSMFFFYLAPTNRLTCNMTYPGQVMSLTKGQIFNLTFWGHILHHSKRLDERNEMAFEILLYLALSRSYRRQTVLAKNGHFEIVYPCRPNRWPEVKSDDLFQIGL